LFLLLLKESKKDCMIRHSIVIAKNTFKETVRDRIILGSVIIAVLTMLVSFFVGTISLDQDVRIIIDLSLTAIYLLQIFIAIFIASSLVHKEIERKTFFLILPKPIDRQSVILGKGLGLLLTVTVVTLITSSALAALLTIKGALSFFPYVALALFFSSLEVVLLILVAFMFSLLSSPILSALFTVAIFLVGHSGSIIQTIVEKTTSIPTKVVLEAVYYVLPNLEKFNLRNEVVYKIVPDIKVFVFAVSYVFIYGVILFYVNRLLFQKKEF
jgi:ABC-type transport system involved in multi-copper enzyme maturation permease subunit